MKHRAGSLFSAAPPPDRRQLWIISGAIALAVLLVFGNSLRNTFVWDDEQFVLKNSFLTSWSLLPQLLSRNVVAGAGLVSNLYRPLQSLTHLLDVRLWGYHAWGHHLTNVLWQTAMAVAVFRLLVTLFPLWPAALAALLFALHPLQSEAVAYISGRGDTMAITWLCLGLLAFRRRLWLSLLCAALAVLSKESLALFPVLLILYDQATGRPAPLKRYLPFWALTGVYVALRLTVLNFSNTLNFYSQPNILTERPLVRLYTYLTTLPKGLLLWLWPIDLHHERSWFVYASPDTPQVWGACLIVVLLAVAAVVWWKRSRPAAAGLCWFVAATIPTSNLFVLINALFYDHWFLLPGLGLAFVVGQALTRAWTGPAWRRQAAMTACGAALALCALMSWRYNGVWQGPIPLYTHILRWEPRSAKTYNNLGMAYADAGQVENAMRYYQRAVALSDEYPQTHHNLGNLYEIKGEVERALQEFQRAVAMNPAFHHSWIRIGAIQLKRGRLAEAAGAFEAAIRAYPYAPEAYIGLAQTRLAQEQPAVALTVLASGRQALPGAVILEQAERQVRAMVPGSPAR